MPARKARGAIVEKGEKRRKVIGDYLNSAESRQIDRSHALRGNAALDAPRPLEKLYRGASQEAFPRGAWERSSLGYFLALAFTPRWRWASNRQTPVATETLRLLTLPAIGSFTR